MEHMGARALALVCAWSRRGRVGLAGYACARAQSNPTDPVQVRLVLCPELISLDAVGKPNELSVGRTVARNTAPAARYINRSEEFE